MWGMASAVAAGHLRRRGMRVPYTRKVFHFAIFTGAALVHAAWGLPGTNSYAVVVVGMVLLAVAAGRGNGLYDALARETDHPRETLFILIPLVTTGVGGLIAALWTGPYAAVGYLVQGWGDAVGEPVGARFGRHRYRVPSLAGVPATRSWEGSAAVFVASWAAAAVALFQLGVPGSTLLGVSLACAAASAVVEGVSNHGLDNLTVQVAVSGLAWALLG